MKPNTIFKYLILFCFLNILGFFTPAPVAGACSPGCGGCSPACTFGQTCDNSYNCSLGGCGGNATCGNCDPAPGGGNNCSITDCSCVDHYHYECQVSGGVYSCVSVKDADTPRCTRRVGNTNLCADLCNPAVGCVHKACNGTCGCVSVADSIGCTDTNPINGKCDDLCDDDDPADGDDRCYPCGRCMPCGCAVSVGSENSNPSENLASGESGQVAGVQTQESNSCNTKVVASASSQEANQSSEEASEKDVFAQFEEWFMYTWENIRNWFDGLGGN